MSGSLTLTLGGSVELILKQAPPAETITTIVTARYGLFSATAKGDYMAYTLPVDMLVVVQVAYVDGHGNPAAVDGPVQWDTSNAAIVDIRTDANDTTLCTLTAVGTLGTAQVTAEADADLGNGIRTLVTTLDVTTVAGEAVAGSISVVGEAQPVAPHVEPRA